MYTTLCVEQTLNKEVSSPDMFMLSESLPGHRNVFLMFYPSPAAIRELCGSLGVNPDGSTFSLDVR